MSEHLQNYIKPKWVMVGEHVDLDDVQMSQFKITINLSDINKCIWQGAKIVFQATVPTKYPVEPPTFKCVTPVFHPNISLNGDVQLNVEYKPHKGVGDLLDDLIKLFIDPRPTSKSLNHEAAALLIEDFN